MTEAEWNASADPAAMLRHLTHKRVHAVGQFGTEVVRETPLISYRKLRLLACACCRMVWPLLTDERSRRAVEVAERYADGNAGKEELDARYLENEKWELRANPADQAAAYCCLPNQHTPEQFLHTTTVLQNAKLLSAATIAALLRRIVGNVFSPVVLPREKRKCERCKGRRKVTMTSRAVGDHLADCPDCHGTGTIDGPCPWLTPLVVSLAENAYEDNGGRKCRYCNGGPPDLCDKCDHNSGWIGVGTLDPDRLAVLSDAAEEAGCDDERVLRHLRGWVPQVLQTIGTAANPGKKIVRGWTRRTIPFVRGDAILDLILGYS